MRDKHIERALKSVERGVARSLCETLFSKGFEFIVPDTSFLIDLQDATNVYRGEHAKYARPDLFLENLRDGKREIVIAPGVSKEIGRHGKVKVNGNVFEISPQFLSYLAQRRDYGREILKEIGVLCDTEKVRLDIYWTTKEACKDCPKKAEEGFSREDSNLLYTAGLLQHAFDKNDFAELLGRVAGERSKTDTVRSIHVLSSDEHILSGARFLRDKLGYDKINPVGLQSK